MLPNILFFCLGVLGYLVARGFIWKKNSGLNSYLKRYGNFVRILSLGLMAVTAFNLYFQVINKM